MKLGMRGVGLIGNLSKSAKRIYFPHSLIESTGNPLVFDYILSPISITTHAYKKHKKGAKILNAGYPKFDKSLEEYHETLLNTITYAPLLRYVDESNNVYVNLFIGYENNLVEWLLENTHYQISYRTHPLNVYANHGYYQLIKENWRNEERVSFDEALGSGFYNFSDFVLSDYSSSAYTFALTTLKPSFFYKPHKTNSNLEKYIPYVCGGGGCARRLKELKSQIETCDFSKMRLKIENFREEIVFNIGKSENYILESIEDILKGKT